MSANHKGDLSLAKEILKKAKEAGVESVKFDRGGFLYHGRIKSLAEKSQRISSQLDNLLADISLFRERFPTIIQSATQHHVADKSVRTVNSILKNLDEKQGLSALLIEITSAEQIQDKTIASIEDIMPSQEQENKAA